MKLKVLGSSSAGNCYLLQGADGTLVVEAGIAFDKVMAAVGWRLDSIVGCAVTHRHNDHAKHVADFVKRGVPVLALPDVFAAKGIVNKGFRRDIEPGKGYKVGGFTVYPVDVDHDVPCVAFLIGHAEMGMTLFLTDTMMFEYRLPQGIRHLMIEANYSDAILERNINSGITAAAMRSRLLHSHMELGTTLGILAANDLTAVRDIVLIHLSGANSDSAEFAEKVREVSGKPTYVAAKGLELELE